MYGFCVHTDAGLAVNPAFLTIQNDQFDYRSKKAAAQISQIIRVFCLLCLVVQQVGGSLEHAAQTEKLVKIYKHRAKYN